MLDPGTEPYKPKKKKKGGNVIMFVGLQGAGKTTTVAKYANYYKQRKWKVGMVCADTFRAGAFDQLKQNAQKLHVPYYGSYSQPDPVKIAKEGVEAFRKEGFDLIIVDTSGRHQQEEALFEEMEDIHQAVDPDDVVFVMDSTIGQSAQAQAAAFKASVAVGSVVITKLDGHAKGGGALSAVIATGSPVAFTGSGEHFDALDPFDPKRFVNKLLGRGDLAGLAETVRETMDEKAMEDMRKTMIKGKKLCLKDFKQLMDQLTGMGSLSKMVGMIPGMSQMMANAPAGADPTAHLKRFTIILDSLTQKELEADLGSALDHSRCMRIAIGSGHPIQTIVQMVDMARQMGSLMQGLKQSKLLQNEAALKSQMKRDPRAVQQQLAKAFGGNPEVLQRMGGVGNMMKMMQAMEGGGGGGKGGKGAATGGAGGMPGGMAGLQKMMQGGGGGGIMEMAKAMMGGGAGGAGAGAGGMPDMSALAGMLGGGGAGGMPNVAAMRKAMKRKMGGGGRRR